MPLLVAVIYQLWGTPSDLEDYSSWLTVTLPNPAPALILRDFHIYSDNPPKALALLFLSSHPMICPPPYPGCSRPESYSSHIITNNYRPCLICSLTPSPIFPFSCFLALFWTDNPSILSSFNCPSASSSPHFSLYLV